MALRLLGKVAWILDGGGIKQVVQVGEMRAMIERETKPDYLQVISVGTVNGAKALEGNFTKGTIDEIEDSWMRVCMEGPSYICRKRDLIGAVLPWPKIHPGYLYKNRGLRELLKHLDMRKIINSHTEMQIATRNLSREDKYTLFSNHDERFGENPEILRDVLCAAMSIPGAFPLVKIFGDSYCDGLTHSINSAIEAGCDTIFVFTINHRRFSAVPDDEEWNHSLMVPFNIILEELNRKSLKDLSESSNHPSDFKILDVSSATPQSIWQRFIHNLNSFLASLSRGDDPNFVPHLIIPIVAEVPPSLDTLHFKKGDTQSFHVAIDRAYDQTNKILDLLEK